MSAKLGQGGFGTVFKAKRISDGKDIALKIVTTREEEVTVESIRTEAGLMMLLKDAENVISCYETFFFNGRHYLSVEFMRYPLRNLIEKMPG